MDINLCFVIQPFDNTFDKRFDDIYVPAINAAGLKPYRVDRDPYSKNLIEQIESKIEDSKICFADISIDNPNVWYELGYAFASKKDVVMVCDSSRNSFPFDVRTKSIIPYKADSKSDFEMLEKQITEKIKAFLSQQSLSLPEVTTALQDVQGLQPFESTLLAIIMGEQKTEQQSSSVFTLSDKMGNAGFTDMATSVGIRMLRKKGFIECFVDSDWNGNEFDACRLTTSGEDFILSHLDLFELTKKINKKDNQDDNFELPF